MSEGETSPFVHFFVIITDSIRREYFLLKIVIIVVIQFGSLKNELSLIMKMKIK